MAGTFLQLAVTFANFNLSTSPSATVAVKLNVGGLSYVTTMSTIMQYPDCPLAQLCLQSGAQSLINDGKELYIDRNGIPFAYILNFMRGGDQVVLPEDAAPLQDLLIEVDFYQLTRMKPLVQRKLRDCTKQKYKLGDWISIDDIIYPAYRPKDLMKHCRIGHIVGHVIGMTISAELVIEFQGRFGPPITTKKELSVDDYTEASAVYVVPMEALRPKVPYL